MSPFSSYDLSETPPRVTLPRDYNVAVDFVDRNVAEGNGARIAVIDDAGPTTYAELQQRVNRCGNALTALGLEPEQRVLMLMLDSVDFPTVFFGAIKAGLVAVPVNTLLTTDDYDYMLRDSRARALVVSAALLPVVAPLLDQLPQLGHVIVSGTGDAMGHPRLDDLLAAQSDELTAAETSADDIAFWLYSSGSTGRPKGAPHLQADMIHTAVYYGLAVLGIRPDDVVFSAAKLFFAYGLGNAMTFPMAVGATAVLMAERPTPEAVMQRLKQHQATIFYGVPTLYAGILADDGRFQHLGVRRQRRLDLERRDPDAADLEHIVRTPGVDEMAIRVLQVLVAGACPAAFERSQALFAVVPVERRARRTADQQITDFARGDVGAGVVDQPAVVAGHRPAGGAIGDVAGTVGEEDVQHLGRADAVEDVDAEAVDPSPGDVLGQGLAGGDADPQPLGAAFAVDAVVGHEDADELVKPKAVVVLAQGTGDAALADELKQFVKDRLAPYKYPRWIEFAAELPKTATGKIQRFKLRA